MEYYKKTSPLIGYYYAHGQLRGVDGMGEIDAVAAEIAALLGQDR
jgi:adenylate kinase